MRISEVEKKLCMIIPKVYRDFLLEKSFKRRLSKEDRMRYIALLKNYTK